MLDFYEPGALGMVRRFWPESSMVRYAARLASRPRTVTRRAGQLATEFAGIAKGSSPIAPQRRDQRFSDRAWSGNPLLRRTMQTYLALGKTAEDLLADAELGWRDNTRLKFVLSNSGHIAAMVNPPSNPKATYRLAPGNPPDHRDWLAQAETVQGSWWADYTSWLADRSGEMKDAPRKPGSAKFPPLEPAPGTYVLQR